MKDKRHEKWLQLVHQELREVTRLTQEAMSEGRYLQMNQLCTQDIVLIASIARDDKITAKRLAEQLYLPKTTVISGISRLEHRGYIKKVINSLDKRESFLYLTDKGQLVNKEHELYEEEIILRYFEKWDKNEQELLLTLLSKRRC